MNDAIRLTDLRVRYGRVRALDGLSLAVSRGEVYGFLGRNGAGKTTTLRVLMGIVGADAGTIELNGEPMNVRTRTGSTNCVVIRLSRAAKRVARSASRVARRLSMFTQRCWSRRI